MRIYVYMYLPPRKLVAPQIFIVTVVTRDIS